MFRIQLLGEFQLQEVQGQRLSLETRKAQLVLAYLLLHPGPVARDRLAGLLWPDSAQTKADNSLRQALHALRRALEPEGTPPGTYIVVERGSVQFNAQSPHWLDTKEFEDLVKASDQQSGDDQVRCLKEAIALYSGDLLEGCYDDWCMEERDSLREQYLKALQQLVLCYDGRKEYSQAITYAKQILAKSPYQEEIHRQLMYFYYAVGDRNAALQQYRECERILKEELDVDPLPETKALFREIEERTSPARLEELAVRARELLRRYPELGAPFVGRAEESLRLTAAWDQVVQGRGQAVFVTGEAGVGKSRLAQEFVTYTSAKGALVFTGRCYEIEGKFQYQALVDALRHGLPQISSAILSGISALWLTAVIKLLPELSERVPNLQPSAPLLSPLQERNRLFEGLCQFLIGLSQKQPVLIFLDDLQWADESTLQFMHYLIRRLPDKKILFWGTYRAEEVDEEHPLWEVLQQLMRDQLIVEVSLAPLRAEEIEKLVQGMLRATGLQELGQWIHEQSKGFPFFAVELIKSFLEAGILSLDEQGNWRVELTKLSADHIPSSVRALVETRLRRVDRPRRQVLDLAAVTGREFTTELLGQISGKQPEDVLESIEGLQRVSVIVGEQGKYYFRHDVIRQVVYGGLLPERRQRLHKSVGEALERTHTQRLGEIAGELAYHFLRAGSLEQALHYSLQAGEAAKKAYANQEAIAHFSEAARLAEQLKNTDALRTAFANLGHVCVFSGKVDEGLEYCRKALDLTTDLHARARLYETMATGHNYKREHEKALAHCEQAMKELGEQDTSIEMAKICDCAALMLCQLNRYEEAIHYCNRSLHIVEKTAEHNTTPSVLAHLGLAHRQQGNFDRAIEYDLRAVKAAEKSGDLSAIAEAYYEAGLTYSKKRDAPRAIEYLMTALATYEQVGDFFAMGWVYQLMCLACIQSADLDRAMRYAQKSLELAAHHSQAREVATAHGCLGCLSWVAGLETEAEAHFAAALKLAGSGGDLYLEIAEVFALLERPDNALEWLNRGLSRMTSDQINRAKSSVWLGRLRDEPRFKLLIERR